MVCIERLDPPEYWYVSDGSRWHPIEVTERLVWLSDVDRRRVNVDLLAGGER